MLLILIDSCGSFELRCYVGHAGRSHPFNEISFYVLNALMRVAVIPRSLFKYTPAEHQIMS